MTLRPDAYTSLSFAALNLTPTPRAVVGLGVYKVVFLNDIWDCFEFYAFRWMCGDSSFVFLRRRIMVRRVSCWNKVTDVGKIGEFGMRSTPNAQQEGGERKGSDRKASKAFASAHWAMTQVFGTGIGEDIPTRTQTQSPRSSCKKETFEGWYM